MIRTLKSSLFGAALLFCLLGASGTQDSQAAQVGQGDGQAIWEKNQPAPPLRLPTIDGTETIDLADLRGGPILLLEFASW